MKPSSTLLHLLFIKSSLVLLFMFCYVMATAQCTGTNLATSYTSNNGSRGAMFNIVAGANPVTVTSFDVNMYGGTTARYEIYYKAGTYIGSETNAANWTLAGAANSVYAAANNVPTPLPIPLSITIPANTTYGFYITNTASGGLNYTSSATGNVTLATNSDLTLIGGVGKSYPFGSTYSYRLINCTVHYYTGNVTEASAISTMNSTSPAFNQNASSSTLYSACNALIAKVVGTGGTPVSGYTTARVWIDAVQAALYVKRHYQITPGTNGSGIVTLYFTDAEFNSFNTQTVPPALLLPVSTDPGTIAARKANLRVEKRPGISSDGSGIPSTYTGTVEIIDPNDADIVWNGTASRWEVSFSVSGFSGFWVNTSMSTLPLKLISFNGSYKGDTNQLEWETADEINTKEFVIERSQDGVRFTAISAIPASGNGNHVYSYHDNFGGSDYVYYRLKMIDQDGKFTYSSIIWIKRTSERNISVSVFPNPVKNLTTISISDNLLIGSKVYLSDLSGKTVKSFVINRKFEILDMSQFTAGIYLLRLQNGTVQKIIKE